MLWTAPPPARECHECGCCHCLSDKKLLRCVGRYWHLADIPTAPAFVRYWVPAQPVDATQALNLSAGVSNCKVLRGRSLSCRATFFRWVCEYTDKSVPLGKYCLSRPLVFSLDPRCHGLCGSQKYTSMLVANVNRR